LEEVAACACREDLMEANDNSELVAGDILALFWSAGQWLVM
jgi:hypothetical protein